MRSSRRWSHHVVVALLAGCARKLPPAPEDAATDARVSAKQSAPVLATSVNVDIVSSASVAHADAGPAVVATDAVDAVDGKALRARHRARLSTDASAVTILEGGTPRELGKRLCEAVVPARPKDTPILIKPNIGGFEWFKDPTKNGGDDGVRGRTTDPEFVRGIIRCLKARGHERITIAEGFAAKHADWKRLIRVSGYETMAREEKVSLVAMDDDGVFDVEGAQPGKPRRVTGIEDTGVPTLLLPKILAEHLEHGMFISAPKIKAHRFGVVSIAIKGMQGTVMLSDAAPAFHQKWRTHRELGPALELLKMDRAAGQKAYLDALHVFAERMVDVLEVSAPDVVLAEGAPAIGGDGFAKRWPSAEDVAIGGTNPVLVDRVGAELLGLSDNADLARQLGGHRTSPLIEAAARRFGLDLGAVRVEGDGKALLDRARPVHFVSMSGFTLHSDDAPSETVPGAARAGVDAGVALEAHARHVEGLTIDGRLDEGWKSVPEVSFTSDWAGADAGISTRVRFAWSKRALYMFWTLAGAAINADASRPVETERAKLYEEDCVELFLSPDASNKTRYFEVEIGPLGHFLDLSVDRAAKKSDVGWSSRPRIATVVDRDAHVATIEVELRSSDIVGALSRGARLPLGLYRMEGKSPRRYLAWSPTRTAKPDFHVPDAFGTLVIDGDSPPRY